MCNVICNEITQGLTVNASSSSKIDSFTMYGFAAYKYIDVKSTSQKRENMHKARFYENDIIQCYFEKNLKNQAGTGTDAEK